MSSRKSANLDTLAVNKIFSSYKWHLANKCVGSQHNPWFGSRTECTHTLRYNWSNGLQQFRIFLVSFVLLKRNLGTWDIWQSGFSAKCSHHYGYKTQQRYCTLRQKYQRIHKGTRKHLTVLHPVACGVEPELKKLTRQKSWCQDFTSSLTGLMKHTGRGNGGDIHCLTGRVAAWNLHRKRQREDCWWSMRDWRGAVMVRSALAWPGTCIICLILLHGDVTFTYFGIMTQ